jgi:hypothetical protein
MGRKEHVHRYIDGLRTGARPDRCPAGPVPGLSASRGAGWSVTRTSARNGILWDAFPYYRPIYLISDTCLMGPRMRTAAARQSGRGANAAMGHERDLLRQP